MKLIMKPNVLYIIAESLKRQWTVEITTPNKKIKTIRGTEAYVMKLKPVMVARYNFDPFSQKHEPFARLICDACVIVMKPDNYGLSSWFVERERVERPDKPRDVCFYCDKMYDTK